MGLACGSTLGGVTWGCGRAAPGFQDSVDDPAVLTDFLTDAGRGRDLGLRRSIMG